MRTTIFVWKGTAKEWLDKKEEREVLREQAIENEIDDMIFEKHNN